MTNTLYIIWFLISCSDAIGAAVCALFVTRRFDGRYGHFLTLALAGVAIEAVCAGLSLLIWWPTEAVDNPEFAIVRAAARTVKAAGVWLLALYLMNVIDGAKRQ